jgi:hypothetical protein
MCLKDEIKQGIDELLAITPIMKDLHNDVDNQLLFLKHDIIQIDKNKYNKEYDNLLNSLKLKGFIIIIN